MIAAETGHLELAYDYLAEAALMDIDDLEHNTRDGLHMAALAGSWIALVAGLAGMRDRDGTLSFAPRLPGELTRLAFTVSHRGRRLSVEVTQHATAYRLADGEPLHVIHDGEAASVRAGNPLVRPTRKASPAGPSGPPAQPLGREPRRRRAAQ